MLSQEKLEEGVGLSLDFCKMKQYFAPVKSKNLTEILPVVVQDVDSREVLILAYVNSKALRFSLKNKIAAFWSTSRNELWVKGLTSGSVLDLVEVLVNCEQNSLLYLVRPRNNAGACHTKNGKDYRKSCYYRAITKINGRTRLLNKNKGEKNEKNTSSS